MKILIQFIGWLLGFSWETKKEPSPHSTDLLDQPLLQVDDEFLTLRDGCSGILVTGATGSGKSTSVAMELIENLLNKGIGGLVHTCKVEEVQHWLHCADVYGRSDDIILLGPDHDHFNFMAYESGQASSSALTENLVQLLLVVLNADVKGGNSQDQYWEHSKRQLLRNCIDLLQLSGREVTLSAMLKVINTAAQYEEQVYDEHWREFSFCFACLSDIEATEGAATDRNVTAMYWLHEFPTLSSKTRSIVISSVTSLLDVFCRGVLAKVFNGESTFNPESIFESKIILIALPVHKYQDLGIRAQALMRMVVERMINRRKITQDSRPVFLYADESQYFFLKDGVDMLFQSTARGLRTVTICITQSISNYLAIAGQGRESEIYSYFANLKNKCFLSNGSIQHNKFTSDSLSQSEQWKVGLSGSNKDQSGYSLSQQYLPELPAIAFQQLKSGGPENDFEVEAIIWSPNRLFKASGKNWIKATYQQKFI